MGKGIVMELDGEQVSFDLERVDREKLYGKKVMQVVDGEGERCAGAWLTRDGGTVIPQGGLAYVYVRPDLSTVERGELRTLGPDGQPAPTYPSTLGVPQPARGPVPASRLLQFNIASVYALTPEDLGARTVERLKAGDIFEVTFSYRGGHDQSTAFLLSSDQGLFALVGTDAQLDFLDKDAPPPEPDAAEDEAEELDFSMM